MNIPIIVSLVFVALLSPINLLAQEAQSLEGARAAATAIVLRGSNPPDSTRIVPDMETLKAKFATCRNDVPVPYCELTDDKPVAILSVSLNDSTRATVRWAKYYTMRASCPGGRPFEVPIIAATASHMFTMEYKEGKWVAGRGTAAVC